FNSTVKHFSAKNFTDLLHADCLFNQHTEKTQKIVCIFSSNILPPKKSPATGNAGMGPSQCIHRPVFPHVS
ncbi:hypothetical protein AAAU16_10040, partial [Desulfovibrio piger]|uniref:hypothetical protein n=1 Tax=Desulfovibrio piger TaxID=901 RepID=UPI0032C19DD2